MVVECFSIIGVICLVIFGFLRGRKMDYALGTTPLLMVPVAHLIGEVCGKQIGAFIGLEQYMLIIWLDVLALAISSGTTAYLCTKINTVKARRAFLILVISYSVILTCVFIYNVVA